VGKRRLEKAIQQVENKFNFEVKWLPFFLNPALPTEPLNKMEYYMKKFGQRVPSMIENLKKIGEHEGIKFSYGGTICNTLNSHRLIEYADKHGKQDEVMNVLFRNYFEEEKNIGSFEVLADAAKQVGLDREKTMQFLKSDDLKEEVMEKVEKVQVEYGVDGVPFFVFNNKVAFSGAQEPATFLSVFNKLAEN